MVRFVWRWLQAVMFVVATGAVAHAEVVTHVDDVRLLAALEAKGYDFASIFGRQDADLEALYAGAPAYEAIVERMAADVGEVRAEMKAGGRELFEVTNQRVGRVLDMRWMKTSASQFRLVGIVNRLDRRDFLALKGEKTCGEVRLIFRLAYDFDKDGQRLSSRMPVNFNAVYTVATDADGGCTGVAGRWSPQVDEAVDAGWLAGGPLDSDLTFKQLELNAQIVRFPSEVEPGFGGQATYLMRIFGIEGDRVTEKTLENTPDIERLDSDAALKARLAAYIRDNLPAIDEGVYQVPEEFLSRRIISVTTFGSARRANHPFTAALGSEPFANLDLAGMKLITSPQALGERLDNGSCQGCHQAGSTAGFHFIGLDDEATSPLNRIEVGISPHLHAELPRRVAYVEAVADDRAPNRFRPLSSAPPAAWADGRVTYEAAEIGMPCMMPEDAGKFGAGWQCGAGTQCTPLGTEPQTGMKVAQCLLPKGSEAMFSGHPCLSGDVVTNQSQPFNDTLDVTTQFAAFEPKVNRTTYSCRPPRIGVPGGIAYRNCNDADRRFAQFKPGEPMPNEICALVGGKKFDLCVATNNFASCLGGAVNRGNRQACSAEHFCREDYMCQTLPDDIPGKAKVKGIGFCSPTYFIFQMRIDNHATPWVDERSRDLFGDKPMYRSVEVEDEEGVEEAQ